jgi:hypothetical protein
MRCDRAGRHPTISLKLYDSKDWEVSSTIAYSLGFEFLRCPKLQMGSWCSEGYQETALCDRGIRSRSRHGAVKCRRIHSIMTKNLKLLVWFHVSNRSMSCNLSSSTSAFLQYNRRLTRFTLTKRQGQVMPGFSKCADLN